MTAMKKCLRILAVLMALCLFLDAAPVLTDGAITLIAQARAAAKPTLSVDEKTLPLGKTFTLTVKNAGGKKVTWSTSDRRIATVSSTGVVKALKVGLVNITAKVGTKKLVCEVWVPDPTIVSSIRTKKGLAVGYKSQLKVKNAGTARITWTSSNKNIATVSSTGLVTAKKKGKVTVYATLKYGFKTMSIGYNFTTYAAPLPSMGSITWMDVGEKDVIKLWGTGDAVITWKSSRPTVATVTSKGTIKALKQGTTIITAMNGKKKVVSIELDVQNVIKTTTKTETKTIKYATEYQDDDTMYTDETQVVRQGVNGTKKVTYLITTVNGKQTKKEVKSETITKKPVSEIIKRGTLTRPAPEPDPDPVPEPAPESDPETPAAQQDA